MFKNLSQDLVQSGRTCQANLSVRYCPVRKLICPVRLSPTFGYGITPCSLKMDAKYKCIAKANVSEKTLHLGTPLLAPDFTHSNRFSARAKTVVKRSQIKSVLILLQPVWSIFCRRLTAQEIAFFISIIEERGGRRVVRGISERDIQKQPQSLFWMRSHNK